MESLSPRIAAAARPRRAGARLWWTGWLPAAIALAAIVALAALGHAWGWSAAVMDLLSATPSPVTPSPRAQAPDRLPDLAALQAERGQLIQEIAQLKEQRLVERQLATATSSFADVWQDTELLSTRVIVKDPYKVLPSFIVDVGSNDQVKVGQPVLGQIGVIGRVTRVWPHRARVDLLSSPAVGFGAMVQSSRALGVVQGAGNELRMDFVAQSSAVVSGDWVVTSGVPGLTPAGLPLGIVDAVVKASDALTLEIRLTPLEDPWLLETVEIVRATGEPAPADALLETPTESHAEE